LLPKTTATTDPVSGEFVLLTLEAVGTSYDILAETEPTCCCAVITKLSEDPTPAVTFTEVAESLIQREESADEAETRVFTLLSTVAKFEPTTVTEKLPLEGATEPFVTAANAGTLNETAIEKIALVSTSTEAITARL
jgi:hypothetical protein